MKEFETVLPEHCHTTIQKTVVTMKEMKNKVKTGDVVYKIGAIYSRVMCLLNPKQIDLKDSSKYELSPVPLSLVDKNGDGKLAKQKADLKNRLKEEVPKRTCLSKNVVVLDGWLFFGVSTSLKLEMLAIWLMFSKTTQ